MDTSQILDLFTVDSGRQDSSKKHSNKDGSTTAAAGGGKASLKNIMEEMDDLWDEKQYENEYDLENFMGSLQNQ